MSDRRIEVFLTGAGGFLGHYVLADLLADPRVCCRVLLRPPVPANSARLGRLLEDLGLNLAALVADGRVAFVEGELPDSLHPSDFAGVDLVLHAAGNTRFHARGGGRSTTNGCAVEPARTNVDGTRAILALATDAKIRRFVYVSTAYVWGEQVGHLPEAFCATMPPVRNDYERSKWEAEKLVWDWGKRSGHATICRPSILFGDSRTGRATAMKGLYVVAKATDILARAVDGSGETDRHHIPLRILGRGDATCNVVPVDWAARQIAHIALAPATRSSVHHVTNPDPPTHQEVKVWLEEHFDIAGGCFSDATWPLEDANHYEELFYSLGNICLDYFRHGMTFASRSAADIPSGKRLVDRASFLRCLQYAKETNWCRTPSHTRTLRAPTGEAPWRGTIDPKWYFERFLPEVVPQSVVAKVSELTAIVQYTITGPRGGSWVSRLYRGDLKETHAVPTALKPEFEYRLSHEDLVDVVTCRKPLQDVFFHGTAEMFGDIERALKMVPIIGEFLKEFPVDGAAMPVETSDICVA